MKVPEEQARQGKRGRPVLVVLIVSLLLALVVWVGVGIYGDAIEPENPMGEVQEQPADS